MEIAPNGPSDAGDAGEGPEPLVARGLRLLSEGCDDLLAGQAWSLSDSQLDEALVSAAELERRVHASYLRLVAHRASRDDAMRPGEVTVRLLADRLNVTRSRARGDVANAQLIDEDRGDLRELGAELAAGRVSREHLDVARRAVNRVPCRLLRQQREEVAALLTDHALTFAPASCDLLARHLLSVLAPDREGRFDAEAFERRSWTRSVDGTGMVRAGGWLEPAGGSLYTAVLDHLAAPNRLPEQMLPGLQDDRTTGQRYADAQVQMARLAASALKIGTTAGEPPRVVLQVTTEQLAAGRVDGTLPGEFPAGGGAAHGEHTGALRRPVWERLSCDAVLDRVLFDEFGAVVDLSTTGRLATSAQRRALAARDGGCTWPGCALPARWCDAHHVVWWTRGGPTTVENLALLCQHHHTQIHLSGWTMAMVHGRPWFTPPAWVDPARRPVRNTFRDALEAVRRVAKQIALDLPPPFEPPPVSR